MQSLVLLAAWLDTGLAVRAGMAPQAAPLVAALAAALAAAICCAGCAAMGQTLLGAKFSTICSRLV